MKHPVPVTSLFSALLAALTLAPVAGAQQITALDQTQGTLGTVIRVTGVDLGNKPKLVLALDGAPVKKTKLKLVAKSDDGTSVDVELKRALAGDYNIALRKGKQLLAISEQTFSVLAPGVASVDPGTANVGTEVDVVVENPGNVKFVVRVGSKKAKIKNIEDIVPAEGGAPSQRATIVVPKVPNGTWPIVVQNRVGSGILKSALTVGGSNKAFVKPGAVLQIEGGKPFGKPFKASKKRITVNVDDANDFEVAALAGGKKSPRAFALTIPSTLETIAEGDSFSTAPANIAYSVTRKGTQSSWLADPTPPGNTWAIDVIAVTDELMAFYVCGELARVEGNGPDPLMIFGIIVAAREATVIDNGLPCEPFATADFEFLDDFVATPQFDNVFATYQDSGGIQGAVLMGLANSAGPVNFGFSITFDFDPNTQNAAVINGINFQGQGLRGFSYTEADDTPWVSMLNPDLSSSVTLTITDNLPSTSPDDGANGYLVGTFTGTVFNLAALKGQPTSQTISGSFCSGWNNLSDFPGGF